MSATTITQYQQVSLSDMETLTPTTGPRIAVTTQDQSYRVFISDGTQWVEMPNSRTENIPYTFLTSSGTSALDVPCTPACHFDASDSTTLGGATHNSPVSSWKSLTGGHELTQNVLTDQPIYTSDNDPDNNFGVHMNTPGAGMQTNNKNNPQISGQTITFVVYKPIGSTWTNAPSGAQTGLYRDITHSTAQALSGNYYVSPWGSNSFRKITTAMDDIRVFFAESSQHHYQYTGLEINTYTTFPKNNANDTDIGGIGKLEGFNQNFVDKRQLSVVITTPVGNGSETSRYNYSRRTLWNSYWNVQGNANRSSAVPWSVGASWYFQTSKYDGFYIGTKQDQSWNPNCMVNEVAVFNQYLSPVDINNICDHLVNKWTIDNWLPIQEDAHANAPVYYS